MSVLHFSVPLFTRSNPLNLFLFMFCSVPQSSLTLCDHMNCSISGLPFHHQNLELAQTHPLSQWCHPTISSSVIPFSFCLQPFPESGSFPMSQFFASGGQSIGDSALASVLPRNIQDWLALGLTGWISLQSKGLSRIFPTSQFKSINSSVLSFLYIQTLTSIHDYKKNHSLTQFSSVQSLSHVQLFATPWIAARQASLSITNSWSLLKLMPI